jgi:hypothetical protein
MDGIMKIVRIAVFLVSGTMYSMHDSPEYREKLNDELGRAMLLAITDGKELVYQFVPLIEKKADVNLAGHLLGSRPLWLAARYGSLSTVLKLIGLNADLTLHDRGHTVETWAREHAHYSIANHIRACAVAQTVEPHMIKDITTIVGDYARENVQENKVNVKDYHEKIMCVIFIFNNCFNFWDYSAHEQFC